MADKKRFRYPLHVTISTLFIALILLLGVVLSWQSYSKTSAIIFSSADQVYDQIARELALDFKATYNPVADTLQLLALGERVAAAERGRETCILHASCCRVLPKLACVPASRKCC